MNITIKTIPHKEQRYETVGDWWFDKGNLEIRISDLGNWKMESMIAVHELVEVLLCKSRGITQKMVDRFDFKFEKDRKEGNEDEPGDDPKAPYHLEHGFGTAVERMLCAAFGINWKEYEKKVLSLL